MKSRVASMLSAEPALWTGLARLCAPSESRVRGGLMYRVIPSGRTSAALAEAQNSRASPDVSNFNGLFLCGPATIRIAVSSSLTGL
jgi:hypothetical protein